MYSFFVFVFLCIISCFPLSAQWTQCNGPFGGEVHAITVSDDNIIIGTSRGIYFSKNNGQEWLVSDLLSPTYSLTTSGEYIYAGTSNGVYISKNKGISWATTNLTGKYIYSLTVSGKYIYAGTPYEGAVFISSDNGQNWEQLSIGLPSTDIYSIAVNGQYLFVGTDRAIYSSTNNGKNWKQSCLTNADVSYLVVSEGNIFAATVEGGVYISMSNGAAWSQVNNGLKNWNVGAITVKDGKIYAGTLGDGVYVSNINGVKWDQKGIPNTYIFALAVHNGVIYAGSNSGLFISNDNGNTWLYVGITKSNISTITGKGQYLFVGTWGGGTFRSNNNGDSWSSTNSLNPYISSLAIYEENLYEATVPVVSHRNWRIYISTGGGVNISTNQGQNWKKTTLASNWINKLYINAERIYVISRFDTLYVTTDGGEVWKRTGLSNEISYFSLANDGQYLYAGSPGGFYASTNYGEQWTKTGLEDVSVNALAIKDQYIYAGTDLGVFVSKDHGKNWTMSDLVVKTRNLLFHGEYVYAATYADIYFSNTNGLNWTKIGTMKYNISALAISNNTLFASTYNDDLWKLDLNSLTSVEEQTNAHNDFDLMLSPNPNNGMLYCTLNSYQDNVPSSLEIYSMQGEKVLQQIIEQPSMTVDISHIPTGIYYVIAHSGNQSTRQMLSLVK